MSIISLHCCSVISQATAQVPMPAFAQTMSIFPSSAKPASTACCISDSERTSATALTARRPVASHLADRLVEIVLGGERVGQGLEAVRADVDGDHVRALSGEPHRMRASLSAAGAGDQRHLPINESHRFSSLPRLPVMPCVGSPSA